MAALDVMAVLLDGIHEAVNRDGSLHPLCLVQTVMEDALSVDIVASLLEYLVTAVHVDIRNASRQGMYPRRDDFHGSGSESG